MRSTFIAYRDHREGHVIEKLLQPKSSTSNRAASSIAASVGLPDRMRMASTDSRDSLVK